MHPLGLVLIFLNFLRYLVDYFSEIAYHYFYSGKHEPLPPIHSTLLLEPAHVLAAKIRKREIRSTDVVKAYIRRIRDIQPIVNAVVDERFAEAIEEARFVDELLESGNKSEDEIAAETPLLGVPVSIKEAIGVKGCLFTVGLPARKGVRAEVDADVVSLLKKAGAIPIAVTITGELCFWWESYNKLYGRCRNPYNTTRTVGGSSGGEGCILGSAGSVIGVGNDIGGSIRIPAAFNGIFGHKPSRGVVSNMGQYPTASPTLQTFLMTGPMCRYATDLLPMLKILAPDHSNKLKLNEKVEMKDIKIYYMVNDGGNPLISEVDPEIRKAQKEVIKYFRKTYGIKAVEVVIPTLLFSFEIWAKVLTSSGMKPVSVEMTGRTGDANLFVEAVKWLIGQSDHIFPVICSAALYKLVGTDDEKKLAKYYQSLSDLQQTFEDLLGTNGIFIYPTNPDYAPYHGQPLVKPFNVGYTAIFNLLGLPISQCPVAMSRNGMPIGLQIIGGLYNDHLTIAVAEELEKAFGGWVSPTAEIDFINTS